MDAGTKQSRWLKRREQKGLLRPLPSVVAVANGMSASKVDPDRTKRIIRRTSNIEGGEGPAVLLFCEVFNVRVRDVLPRDEWHVIQLGKAGSSLSSLALAVRKSIGHFQSEGAATTPVGPTLGRRVAANLRARQWTRDKVVLDPGTQRQWTLPVAAGHAPPKRGWFLWKAYRMTAPRGLLGADMNKSKAEVREAFPGRQVRQVELMALVIPKHVPVSAARSYDVGGDHPALAVTLFPRAK